MKYLLLSLFAIVIFSNAVAGKPLSEANARDNDQNQRVKIKQAQELLNHEGFLIEVTGKKDRATTTALKLFQKRKNIKPTGVLNARTMQALGMQIDGRVGIPSSMDVNDDPVTFGEVKESSDPNAKSEDKSN